jgi:hypothetical protein
MPALERNVTADVNPSFRSPVPPSRSHDETGAQGHSHSEWFVGLLSLVGILVVYRVVESVFPRREREAMRTPPRNTANPMTPGETRDVAAPPARTNRFLVALLDLPGGIEFFDDDDDASLSALAATDGRERSAACDVRS